jgi:hypothetical protein
MKAPSDEKSRSKANEPKSRLALLKKPWVQLGLFATFLALLLTNLNVILRQSRELPGEWGKTSQQFSAWYYDYAKWPDRWTSHPEGDLDQPVENLSPEGVNLDLTLSGKGELGGTIETDLICKNIAYFESALIEGEVTGPHSAKLILFNFVGGHRRRMAILRAERDGDVMTLTPIDDPWRVIPSHTKITRAPLDLAEPEALCAGKESAFIERIIKSKNQTS